MDENTLSLLCDPISKEELDLISINGDTFLETRGSKLKYSIKNNIPRLIEDNKIVGLNKKYQDMYNRVAAIYDLYVKLMGLLFHKHWKQSRRELVCDVDMIKPNDKVLEVSIGTGFNLLMLPRNAHYFGVDISWKMLQLCSQRIKKLAIKGELFLGEAENLPFKDQTFDVVFHIGGINFFNDKEKAINEMIRVAKPGTKIVIVDETEKHSVKTYEKIPFIRNFFKNSEKKDFTPPLEFIPKNMNNICLKEIWNARFFSLSFTKP